MSNGTEWEYLNKSITISYESQTSDNVVSRDTTFFSNKIEIAGDTTINNLNLKIITLTESRDGLDLGTSIKFYMINENGVYDYTYNSGDSDPTAEIILPLTNSSLWVRFKNPESSSEIRKEVVGFDNITINGEEVFCFKVKVTYIDPRVEIYDYVYEGISESGLVKYEALTSRSISTDDNGITTGYIKSFDTKELVRFSPK